MKIRTKLAMGFGSVAILLLGVGIICLLVGSYVNRVGKVVGQYNELRVTVTAREVDHLKWSQSLQGQIMTNVDAIRIQSDPTQCALGKWIAGKEYHDLCTFDPEFKKVSAEILEPHAKLHATAKGIISCWQTIHPGLLQTLYKRLDDHRCWALAVATELNENRHIDVQTDPTKCAFGKWLASDECVLLERSWPEFAEELEKVKSEHKALHSTVIRINESEKDEEKHKLFNQETIPHLQKVATHFDKIIEMEDARSQSQKKAKSIFEEQTLPLLSQTQKIFAQVNKYGSDVAAEHNAEQQELLKKQKLWVIVGLVAGFSIAVLVGTLISVNLWKKTEAMVQVMQQAAAGDLTVQSRDTSSDEIGMMAVSLNNMVQGFRKVVSDIRVAANQTASSSEELSSTAQGLSSGAQNQAAAVEEMTASVSELKVSIERVAQNARTADQSCQDTMHVVEQGGQCVDKSLQGMEQIKESSTQIAKISNVIRQIASQTNLLALNAAIEAASAGEHGLGFAVVAEEVRKLAERAGKAADEITHLIDESGKRVDNGAQMSGEVGGSLQSILIGIQKTAADMAQIASGTGSQADTAQQVSSVIDNISAVTEENSASAEEMAASAEELSAQAQQMLTLVEKFKLD